MALAKEFGVSEKRTEREIDSLLLSAKIQQTAVFLTISIPKFENLMTALHYNGNLNLQLFNLSINYITVNLVQ